MLRDVIFLSALIVVLFVAWLALKLNIRVRRKRATEIKHLNLSGYITFVKNFKLGEEAEKAGDSHEALKHFRLALSNLEEEEKPDELTLETIEEVKNRISALESSVNPSN